MAPSAELMGWAAAIGAGLLIGIERERRKGSGAQRAPAGLRSFLIAALLGALAMRFSAALLPVAVLSVGALATAAYVRSRSRDPGLTTELALLLTVLLGALALHEPALAAALAVLVTAALAARESLHRLVRERLTTVELQHGVLLLAAVLIVLPLLPAQPIAWLAGLNLRRLWLLAVLVMAIQTLGHFGQRLLGPGRGLLLAGLLGGFVSSTATIAAMGQRARADARSAAFALGAALWSNVATIVQLALLVAVLSPSLLRVLALPLLASGLAALAAGAWSAWRMRGAAQPMADGVLVARPFDPRSALLFAAVMSLALLLAEGLRHWLGTTGVLLAAGLSGLADAHAAAASAAQLHAGGALAMMPAQLAVLCGLSSNMLSKSLAAGLAGGLRFGMGVAASLALMLLALWAAWLLPLATP